MIKYTNEWKRYWSSEQIRWTYFFSILLHILPDFNLCLFHSENLLITD